MMAPPVRPLLNKPEYWKNAFAAGYLSTTYDAKGKLPPRTQALMDKIRPKLGKGEIDFMFWWIALGYDTVKLVEHRGQDRRLHRCGRARQGFREHQRFSRRLCHLHMDEGEPQRLSGPRDRDERGGQF